MSSIVYNERAWQIDVVGRIKDYARIHHRAIQSAGGEFGIPSPGEKSLFPDILLFGGGSDVLQGWELKFPDTAIDDEELLSNATEKAKRLRLSSFLVWNVSVAVLYRLNPPDSNAHEIGRWTDLVDITRRDAVKDNESRWVGLLGRILEALNDYFERGELSGRGPVEVLNDDTLAALILDHSGSVAAQLSAKAAADGGFRAEVGAWWAESKAEYAQSSQWEALARVNLLHWLNRFVFAHYLKRFSTEAQRVDNIQSTTTPEQASAIFRDIVQNADFGTVLQGGIGDEIISDSAWRSLTALNALLSQMKLGDAPVAMAQQTLESVVAFSRRKAAGQFTTPRELANLVAGLAIDDTRGEFLDPCCGSGTIARAVYDLKVRSGLGAKDSIGTVWAEDKFAFPVQIASLVLSDPVQMGEVHRIFQSDAFSLTPGKVVSFRHPFQPDLVSVPIPLFDAIGSNLPFVRFEDLPRLEVQPVQNWLEEIGCPKLSGRSDYLAYFPFWLWNLLKPRGRLCLITGNSWLGTDWGEQFRVLLERFYHVAAVVVSGSGRWFRETDVVTTILLLIRRESVVSQPQNNESTCFVTLREPVEALADEGVRARVCHAILNRQNISEFASVRVLSREELARYEDAGLTWRAPFVNLAWLDDLLPYLRPVTDFFEVARGERRGWDPLFYPGREHRIEAEYLRPVLKTPASVNGLIADPDGEAFCCSKTESELVKLGHIGALQWIGKFATATNGVGKPLPTVLARAGQLWYELRPETLADLVASIDYGDRLFIGRMRSRAFVNQRLTRFTRKPDTDVDLAHALLNSLVGLFYIEAIGFGRGLGALDLNATRLKQSLRMLDPAKVSVENRTAILDAFRPLLTREVLPLREELARDDRVAFDRAVLRAVGKQSLHEQIREALADLYDSRATVSQR